MRTLAATAIAALLALTACEDSVSTDIQESPSIVTEDGAPELSGDDTFAADPAVAPLFRGVGQEPGWIVRIYEDEIVYEADYGERTVRVPTPDAEETEDGRRYVTGQLTVEIVDDECADTMSGARYSAQVTITEGERSVRGCGGEQYRQPGPGEDDAGDDAAG